MAIASRSYNVAVADAIKNIATKAIEEMNKRFYLSFVGAIKIMDGAIQADVFASIRPFNWDIRFGMKFIGQCFSFSLCAAVTGSAFEFTFSLCGMLTLTLCRPSRKY